MGTADVDQWPAINALHASMLIGTQTVYSLVMQASTFRIVSSTEDILPIILCGMAGDGTRGCIFQGY